MSQKPDPLPSLPNFTMPAGKIVPFDLATGAVQPPIAVSGVVGFSSFGFDFFNEGGTNNLKPGRPTKQTAPLRGAPEHSTAFVCLSSVLGAFVTNGGATLTERPLGEFHAAVGFVDHNTISCTVQLSDSNSDDPVKISVRGIIVYFR